MPEPTEVPDGMNATITIDKSKGEYILKATPEGSTTLVEAFRFQVGGQTSPIPAPPIEE